MASTSVSTSVTPGKVSRLRQTCPPLVHEPAAADDVVEAVADRPVVGAEDRVVEGDGADPHAVQPGVDQALEDVRLAAVGVDVDGRLGVHLPDPAVASTSASSRVSASPSHPWPKDTMAASSPLEVPVGEAHQLVGGGREAHPVLRERALTVALQGDAAQAVGVAAGRSGQRALVAAVEGVLRRVAAVLEGAVGEVVDEAVAGQRRRAASTAAGRSARPYRAGSHHSKLSCAQRRTHEVAVVLDHGRVAEERQTVRPGVTDRRREQGAQVSDGQDRATASHSPVHPDRARRWPPPAGRRPGRWVRVASSGSGSRSSIASATARDRCGRPRGSRRGPRWSRRTAGDDTHPAIMGAPRARPAETTLGGGQLRGDGGDGAQLAVAHHAQDREPVDNLGHHQALHVAGGLHRVAVELDDDITGANPAPSAALPGTTSTTRSPLAGPGWPRGARGAAAARPATPR